MAASKTQEKMFYIQGSSGHRLLCFLHLPAKKRSDTGIVYCHPFAEEKNCSHAIVVKAARAFADEGFPVLRFDLSGCGDSEGQLEEVTVGDWLFDMREAMAQLKANADVENIALWGLRLGAGLSLLAGAEHPQIRFLILWQPVLGFERYMHQFLRQSVGASLTTPGANKVTVQSITDQLAQGKVVEISGYPIAPKLYESLVAVGDTPSSVDVACPLFVTSISMMEKPAASLQKYVDRVQEKQQGAELAHSNCEPFWDRYWRWEAPDVIDRTSQWLRSQR